MTSYQAYAGHTRTASNDSSSTLCESEHASSKNEDIERGINRTPSPTPSEQAELSSGTFNWKKLASWRFWFRREWLWYYVAIVVIFVVVILLSIYHKQIVDALKPAIRWMHKLPGGWLIPIAILFIISFPPLFGHEIIAVLCGMVWGAGVGFAIVAAGTFLGEVANFYAFRYCLRARAEKLEKTQISYACLARVIRDGGIWIPLIARFSVIPSHFTTAIFSTCGMGIIIFAASAFLSLPKQFITVYLGVILEQSGNGNVDTKNMAIRYTVIGVTLLIAVLAMWYIFHQMDKVKPQIIYERRKARQVKLQQNAVFVSSETIVSVSSDPFADPSKLGSTGKGSFGRFDPSSQEQDGLPAQQWDEQGRAVGYVPDPRIVAPQPRRAHQEGFDLSFSGETGPTGGYNDPPPTFFIGQQTKETH